MSEARKLAAILVTNVVGYCRLAEADEDRTLARLRALRGDLIDRAVAARACRGSGERGEQRRGPAQGRTAGAGEQNELTIATAPIIPDPRDFLSQPPNAS